MASEAWRESGEEPGGATPTELATRGGGRPRAAGRPVEDEPWDLPRVAFELRNLAAALPVVIAFAFAHGNLRSGVGAWCAALALCSGGIALRAWATTHCTYAQGFRKTLATGGPYRWARNPLYLGNLAIIGSALAASQHLWLVPLGMLWALVVYDRAVRHEERRLVSRYGARYFAYRAATPRWIPRPPRPFWPEGPAPFARCVLRQSRALLLLAPFLLREAHVLRFFQLG